MNSKGKSTRTDADEDLLFCPCSELDTNKPIPFQVLNTVVSAGYDQAKNLFLVNGCTLSLKLHGFQTVAYSFWLAWCIFSFPSSKLA